MRLHPSFRIAALSLMCASAHADWQGSGELGILSSRGNTETDTANAKLDIANQLEQWKHGVYATALYGADETGTTAQRWETRWQSDYRITDPLYWFGGARYERDKFGSFSYQESLSTGLGYKFIDSEATRLSAQFGVGAKRSQEQTLVRNAADEVIDRIQGEEATRAMLGLGVNFEHALTSSTKLINKLLVETASYNTFVQNDLSLHVAINNSLALSVGYGIRQNSSPPPDSERLDTITTLNLVYSIK
jgi:putative salt-induced outer membrane protein